MRTTFLILLFVFITFSSGLYAQVIVIGNGQFTITNPYDSPQCFTQISLASNSDQCSYGAWVLAFQDDFTGNELDTYKWKPVLGVPRGPSFNQQKAWHKPENLHVSDGILEIVAKKEFNGAMAVTHSYNPLVITYEDFDYTTGEIWSKNEFGFGRFQAKVELPSGNGLFPAFWLFSQRVGYNEIDIFEFFGEEEAPETYQTNLYTDCDNDGNTDNYSVKQKHNIDYSQNYHVFELIWEKDKISWYIDGDLRRVDYRYYDRNGSLTGCVIKGFHAYLLNKLYPLNPMALILNLAIRCNEHVPNGYDFPVKMKIDWVKYYKRGTCLEDVEYNNVMEFKTHEHNSISGQRVTLGGDFEVPQNQQLDVLAEDYILLTSGFEVKANSNFLAEIVNPICNSVRTKNSSPILTPTRSKEPIILIYPNPTTGELILEYSNIGVKGINVQIWNSSGRLIQRHPEIMEAELGISLSGLASGYYMVEIFDLTTKVLFTYPIVLN